MFFICALSRGGYTRRFVSVCLTEGTIALWTRDFVTERWLHGLPSVTCFQQFLCFVSLWHMVACTVTRVLYSRASGKQPLRWHSPFEIQCSTVLNILSVRGLEARTRCKGFCLKYRQSAGEWKVGGYVGRHRMCYKIKSTFPLASILCSFPPCSLHRHFHAHVLYLPFTCVFPCLRAHPRE